MMRGRTEDARRTLASIEPHADVDAELADMQRAISEERGGGLREMLRSPYLKATVFVVGLGFFIQITGINAVVYYSPRIFEAMGFTGNAALLLLPALVQAAALVAVFVSLSLVDRVGRRPILLGGIGMMIVANIILVAVFMVGRDFGGALTVVGFLGVLLFTVGFTFGFGALVWVYAGESFPARLRSLGASAMLTSDLVANVIVAAFFLTMLQRLGGAGTFAVFGLPRRRRVHLRPPPGPGNQGPEPRRNPPLLGKRRPLAESHRQHAGGQVMPLVPGRPLAWTGSSAWTSAGPRPTPSWRQHRVGKWQTADDGGARRTAFRVHGRAVRTSPPSGEEAAAAALDDLAAQLGTGDGGRPRDPGGLSPGRQGQTPRTAGHGSPPCCPGPSPEPGSRWSTTRASSSPPAAWRPAPSSSPAPAPPPGHWDRDGREARAGGWGYLLGDEGSGYAITRSAVRNALAEYDRGHARRAVDGAHPGTDRRLPDRRNSWTSSTGNPERRYWAGLAGTVFDLRSPGRRAPALAIAEDAAQQLAVPGRRGQPPAGHASQGGSRDRCFGNLRSPVLLAGGMLVNQPSLAGRVRELLAARGLADVRVLDRAIPPGAR